MPTKILVTGGAGFIGSHVVDRLVDNEYDVRIFDNLSTGKTENIQKHITKGKAELIKGDIRDTLAVEKSVKDVDVIIHMAALVSVPLSIENPNLTFDINLLGTLNLLRASVKNQIDKFIYISTCAVCGNPEMLPVTEQTPTNPISTYAESKLIGERYCFGFSDRLLLKTIILRFFNVYGLRQTMNDYSGVITRFIERCIQKKPLIIYGDGSQTRDFVNVMDVAEAVLASVRSRAGEGEVFNIASGKPTSINELAKTLLELTGTDLEVIYESPRTGDIKDSYADISKAKKLLGYKPKVSLPDGLRDLLKQRMAST
ncbi:MAG: SDR family NAD(P)-dependent oxidoreductase [Candidatus Bathyarchaeota archaeon]|nr:SDR family NAD(P)-dependent oxidoreductase [Candidatus Bathyarchaeota archaeon]